MPSPYKKIENDIPQSYDHDEQYPLNDGIGSQMEDKNGGSHHNSIHGSLHGSSHDASSYHYSLSPPGTGTGYYSPVSTSPRHSPKRLTSPKQSDMHQNETISNKMKDYNSEDDDDEDLGRYSVVFNQALGINGDRSQHSSAGTSHAYHGPGGVFDTPMPESAKRLFMSIQDARMEHRSKRLERFLALPDDPTIRFHIERCGLCCSAWCDILDKGMYPIILVLILYVVTLIVLGDEHAFVKRIMLGVGIPLFVFRILWRPLSWFICERRKERVSATAVCHQSYYQIAYEVSVFEVS